MKRVLLFVSIILPFFFFAKEGWAQTQETQTVRNGQATSAINFASTGCIYTWLNNTPSIGLGASGTGNIAPFTAINNGNTPITATISVTPVQSPGYAFITNAGNSSVSIIDIYTKIVLAKLYIGTTPIYISVSPDGTKAYISNYDSSDISVMTAPYQFDLQEPTIKVDPHPAGLAVTPDGTELFVCNNTYVSVINTTTQQIVAKIPMGQYPNFMVFSPDGSKAYVTNNYLDTVSIINTATNKVTSSFSAGKSPTGEVITPNGQYLYVANTYDNDVSVFNTADNKLVTNIPVGIGPLGMTISADGQTVYAINSGNNETSSLGPGSVSVISTATNKVTTAIALGKVYPLGASVTPDGSQLYVVCSNTNQVTIINTATNVVSEAIDVAQLPNSIGNFMAKAPPCTASPFQYTIIVNPSSNITVSNMSGEVTACSGSDGAGGSIPFFTISGNKLVGGVTATAPENFLISLNPNGGYSNSITLTPVDGTTLSDTKIYVEASSSAQAGSISGNVVLSSSNTNNQDVAVTGIVSASVTPTVFITASAINTCTGTPVTFMATPYNGGTTPVYQWLVNGHNAGANSATFSSSTLNDGDMVTCMMTSNAPCVAPASIASNEIIMNVSTQMNVPSVSILASNNNTCAGSPVIFTATPVNGGNAPTYQWQVNGNNAGTNSATFTSTTLANEDVVTCLMTASASCSVPSSATSNPVTMIINALPVVNAGGNKTIVIGKGVILNATAQGNITDITWSPATGLSNYKILNPVASPTTTTTYTLTVQTSDGCMASNVATVQVIYPIVIPNTFTPNGDGRNDTWDIKYLDAYSNCKVQIFNRWGQLLYSSTGYGIPWDGTYKGKEVPSGTYYYIINLSKNTKPLAGALNVVR